MSGTREEFLNRVRHAVKEGNRAGMASTIPARGKVGYQGAGQDPVTRFRDECTAAGGQVHLVADATAARAKIKSLVSEKGARRILLGRGPFLDSLDLTALLTPLGVQVDNLEVQRQSTDRECFFAADIGITGVAHLIAETGSIVFKARPEEPRSLSLLPPVHIAVANRREILPDLFDLFTSELQRETNLPSVMTLITGPSKTGDIELRLVTGVHGPGEVHVVLLTEM